MTIFQLLMLGASAFFAYKIYEHVQTLQDPEQQEDDMRESIEEAPRTAESFSTFDSSDLVNKADEEMQNGNLEKALAIYSEANIKEPGSDETLFKMGYVLALQERNDEALEYFIDSLEIDRGNPFTHLEMALLYIKDSEFASARFHLNQALEIDPDLERAQEELVKLNAEK
ncbi:tetratricopeptide repeat protein [Sulfurimonas sp.]|jgi:tetratricopeptide (TPR) repeat protein|uniref:tetratricopeptide repeat protein n=1 Tax=Sulfurimonas sp. TaxID=2022749 RepID=UPI0025E3F05D|nr:tetratricopeptide repeat protein [Sulfurimonas sp.]MBT5936008.1 hypothetical protein [Sulfurimonas sp.]